MDINTYTKITDEELKPYENLFNEACEYITKEKKPKDDVIIDLANELAIAGFPEQRVCSAIVKKLTVINLDTGRKYANRDYIRRLLSPKFKRRTLKPTANTKANTKAKKKDLKEGIVEAIKEEIEVGKENKVKAAFEIEKEVVKTEIMKPDTEIELDMDDDSSELIVDAPPAPAPVVDNTRVKALEEELISLKNDLDDVKQKYDTVSSSYSEKKTELVELRKDYEKLLAEKNRIAKPYMERRWMIVPNLDGSHLTIEVDAIAIPETRRINIPRDTKNVKFARVIPFEVKPAHDAEWDKFTEGKRSIDIKLKSKTKAEA